MEPSCVHGIPVLPWTLARCAGVEVKGEVRLEGTEVGLLAAIPRGEGVPDKLLSRLVDVFNSETTTKQCHGYKSLPTSLTRS